MKRRSFIGRLLGSIVAAPVAVRALEAEATPRRFVGIDTNREPSRTVGAVIHVHDSIEVEGGTAARSLSFEGGEVVEFSDAAMTAQEIARQINEQAVGVVASLDGDSVVLRPHW